MFSSKLNKVSRVSTRLKLVKTMSPGTLARTRYLHRFFCTLNKASNSSPTKETQHDPTHPKQEPSIFSPSQTREILHKFNTSEISGLLKLKYLHDDCAHAIIARRNKHGSFTAIDDLLEMPHIGPKILPKICQHIITPTGVSEPISPTDEAKVLQTLNERSTDELAKIKYVDQVLAEDIVRCRRTNGEFKSLGDVLDVPQVTDEKLLKICKSIINPPRKTDSDYTRYFGVQNLCDLVTIDIGPKHIAWLHMTRDREVLEWTLYNIEGVSSAKWEPQEYLNLVKDVISKLPTSDLYLMEHKPHIGQTQKDLYKYHVYTRSLEAMFLSLLNIPAGSGGKLGAISVTRNITGRHFGLLVGSNRASGQQLVDEMLRSKSSNNSSKIPEVIQKTLEIGKEPSVGHPHEGAHHFTIATHQESVYRSNNQHQREQLSNCLLHALAFYETVIVSDT